MPNGGFVISSFRVTTIDCCLFHFTLCGTLLRNIILYLERICWDGGGGGNGFGWGGPDQLSI